MNQQHTVTRLITKPEITYTAWRRHAKQIGITFQEYALQRANNLRYCREHKQWLPSEMFYANDQMLCRKCRYRIAKEREQKARAQHVRETV